MTNKELLAKHFKASITSFDEYRAALAKCFEVSGHDDFDYWSGRNLVESYASVSSDYANSDRIAGKRMAPASDNAKHVWWWNREQVRIHCGIYPERSSIMATTVRSYALGQWCVHPSTDSDTPEAVAYTPSPEYGIRDKQLKLSSFGKFLRKYCPLLTDDHIGAIEAAHRAEMDPTIHIATTAEEIADIYQDDSHFESCMRYKPSRWGLPDNIHPSMVYAAPGMGVAYVKNSDGQVTSRALVFTNWDTGTKHYLRVYGDQALKTKLARNGYTLASLEGAKIKVIDYDGYMVVPYLDGIGGDQGNYNGTYGYIDATDPEYIQLVSTERYRSLYRAGVQVAQFKAHSDVKHSRLSPQDLSSLKFTCPLTGVTVDRTRDDFLTVYYKGQVQHVLDIQRFRIEFGTSGMHVTGRGILRESNSVRFNPSKTPYFYDRSRGYMIDTVEGREYCGHVKLSSVHYKDTGWSSKDECVETSDGWVYRRDALLVHDIDDDSAVYHYSTRDVVKRLKARGYIPIGQHKLSRVFRHKDDASLVTLRSGKVVCKDYVQVTTLFDGTVALAKDVRATTVFGRTVFVPKDGSMDDMLVPLSTIDAGLTKDIEYLRSQYGADYYVSCCYNRLRQPVRAWGSPYIYDGKLLVQYSRMYQVSTWADMPKHAEAIRELMADEARLDAIDKDTRRMFRQWLHTYDEMNANITALRALETARAMPEELAA